MDETKPKCDHRKQSLPGVPGGLFPCAEPGCPEGVAEETWSLQLASTANPAPRMLEYKREKDERGWKWML